MMSDTEKIDERISTYKHAQQSKRKEIKDLRDKADRISKQENKVLLLIKELEDLYEVLRKKRGIFTKYKSSTITSKQALPLSYLRRTLSMGQSMLSASPAKVSFKPSTLLLLRQLGVYLQIEEQLKGLEVIPALTFCFQEINLEEKRTLEAISSKERPSPSETNKVHTIFISTIQQVGQVKQNLKRYKEDLQLEFDKLLERLEIVAREVLGKGIEIHTEYSESSLDVHKKELILQQKISDALRVFEKNKLIIQEQTIRLSKIKIHIERDLKDLKSIELEVTEMFKLLNSIDPYFRGLNTKSASIQLPKVISALQTLSRRFAPTEGTHKSNSLLENIKKLKEISHLMKKSKPYIISLLERGFLTNPDTIQLIQENLKYFEDLESFSPEHQTIEKVKQALRFFEEVKRDYLFFKEVIESLISKIHNNFIVAEKRLNDSILLKGQISKRILELKDFIIQFHTEYEYQQRKLQEERFALLKKELRDYLY